MRWPATRAGVVKLLIPTSSLAIAGALARSHLLNSIWCYLSMLRQLLSRGGALAGAAAAAGCAAWALASIISTRANGILITHHSVGGQRCRRPLARRHNSFRFRHNAVQRAAISLSLCRLHSSLLRPRQRQPCLQRWERHDVASHGNVKHTASRRHVGYGWRSSRAVGQPFPAGVAFLQARA